MILILLLILFLISPPLQAQPLLSVGALPAYPGAAVNLPVNFVRATNVVAAQFDVTFDPARVSSGPALADATSPRHTVLSREIAPGVRRVLVYSRQNAVLTNRTPVLLPFTVSPTEYLNSGPITPLGAIFAKTDATAITPLSLASGTIFVRPVNQLPDGRIQFFLPSTPDRRYYIQASADLQTWVNISTNTATGSFLDLVDVDAASYPYRFYRWQAAD